MELTLNVLFEKNSITALLGGFFNTAPYVIDSKIQSYDNLYKSSNNLKDSGFLFKEISNLISQFPKKYQSIDNINFILSDRNFECYTNQIDNAIDEEPKSITKDNVREILNKARIRQTIKDKKAIKVIPLLYKTSETSKVYLEAPIGVLSKNIKLCYAVYFIDLPRYESLRKLACKFVDETNFTISISAVELNSLLQENKIKNNNYVLFDNNLDNSNAIIVLNNVASYSLEIKNNYYYFIRETIEKNNMGYNDLKYILETYGYDKNVHPNNIILYEDKINNLKITQDSLNKLIINFVDRYVKEINELKISLFKQSDVKEQDSNMFKLVFIGDFVSIPGVKDLIEARLNQEIIVFENQVTTFKDRIYLPLITPFIQRSDFDKPVVNKKVESFFELSRGE